MPTNLPRSTPSSQDVDPAGILAFLDAVEADERIELHSLMVVRHGNVVAEGWWAPYSADRVHLMYSMSKSVTSTAAALAAAEGLVDLDAAVVSYFPELVEPHVSEATRAMTLRDVACMSSGHLGETWDRVAFADRQEPLAAFFALPPDQDPGSVFAYNQACTYALGAAVQRTAGQTLTTYLRPRLFDPLGIGEVGWLQTPVGRDQAFSGWHARTEDIAKIGLLYLQNGRWGGDQLLDPAWVAAAISAQVGTADWATTYQEGPDWALGYGYQFWMSQHGYRGDGAYGQFSIVLPELDTVIATTAATDGAQPILDAVWAHLVPALGRATGPDLEAELAERLESLAIAVVPGAAVAGEGWHGATFDRAPDDPTAVASIERIALDRDGDGRWTLTLHEDLPLPVALGFGQWEITDVAVGDCHPVLAASAGWQSERLLRAEVMLLETPHRLLIVCSSQTGHFNAHWHTQPLSGAPVRRLHCPR